MTNSVGVATDVTGRPDPRSIRPLFIIWSGQVCSWFGSELTQFALVWWLTRTTGSASVLAFATTMAVLPRIFVGPFAGALVDRWNRRLVLIVSDSVIALATIMLAVMYGLGVVQTWHIYALLFIRAMGGAFHLPAITASTSMLVPEKHLSRVAGLNQAMLGTIAIVAPPLGAALLEIVLVQGILAIDVATATLAIGPLLFIAVPQPVQHERSEAGAGRGSFLSSVLVDLGAGLRFIWGFKALRIMIGMIMVLNVLGWPLVTLVPILITSHFGGGAVEFGWFQSALGAGGILGGLILGAWGGFKRRVVTMLLALIVDGVAMTVLGLIPASALPVAASAWFLVGVMSSTINGTSMAILQATVPPALQGRVFAVQWSCVTAMSPVGLAVAGPLADAFGPPIWYVIAGVSHAAIGLLALFVPTLIRIEDRAVEKAATDP